MKESDREREKERTKERKRERTRTRELQRAYRPSELAHILIQSTPESNVTLSPTTSSLSPTTSSLSHHIITRHWDSHVSLKHNSIRVSSLPFQHSHHGAHTPLQLEADRRQIDIRHTHTEREQITVSFACQARCSALCVLS
jgi:hypothetical protein